MNKNEGLSNGLAFPSYPPKVNDEENTLLTLESRLKKRIIGQDTAISAVCRAIKRNKVGLKDPFRPVGCFIFAGTSGCGKTELCKVLAEELFGSDKKLIKLDMSEYMTQWDASKLIGAAPGYIGYENGGQLTNKIKQNPESVLCLDEIEKAAPNIYNFFLQIMENGVLTSSQGETVSFKDTIIIFTTNVGSGETATSIGFAGYDEEKAKKADVTAALKKTFKPEFLNRIDEIVVFNRLEEKHILQICNNLLKKVKLRANRINLKISFDKSAVAELARIGYDKEYGARSLRRAISANIEDMLAEKVLTGEINKGDRIRVVYNENGFSAEKPKKQKENSHEF